MSPVRIQRQRTKGWRMPEGAVYVGRPSRYGNPFPTALAFRVWASTVDLDVSELRGRDLACWCSLDQTCHADVLLALANS